MLRSDRDGRASFAILALVTLLLANLSVAYLFQVQRRQAELAAEAAEIAAMRDVASQTHRQVQVAAQYFAMTAIRDATQGASNQTEVNEIFSISFSEFIRRSFPSSSRGFTVSVGECRLVVLMESKVAEDIIRTGTVVAGEDDTYGQVIDNGHPGEPETTERVVYYRLAGHVNYTVSKENTVLETGERVDTELDSPFPFISQQLSKFSVSSNGALSDMAQALRYVLTTVAQYRVLLGYAGGEYLGNDTSTFDVLTPSDIELAVNLILVLEEVKYFRAYDGRAVQRLDSEFFIQAGEENGRNDSASVASRTLSRLLTSYANEGTIDPADIFALFTALDESQLRMNKVLAQVLYAIRDQLVLKYMDYVSLLPIEPLLDLGLKVLEFIGNCWDDFLEWISGDSQEARMVREYVDNLFREMGSEPEVLGPVTLALPAQVYRATNEDGSSHDISISPESYVFPFAYQSLTSGNTQLWESYYSRLFENDLKSIHDGVRDLAMDIASKMSNEFDKTGLFEPVSLLGRVNPKDESALLEYVAQQVVVSLDRAILALRNDPDLSMTLLKNLWQKELAMIRGLMDYITNNYEKIVSPTWFVTSAWVTMPSVIYGRAALAPEFQDLDETGRRDLGGKIMQAMIDNGWIGAAYDEARLKDVTRFETVFTKATSIDTPPQDGGLYQRSMSIISGAEGFLATAGDFVRSMLGGLVRNEVISDDKVLIPVSAQPFRFYDSENESEYSQSPSAAESLLVNQTPDILPVTRLMRDGGESGCSATLGELCVNLVDPSNIPASGDSPNVHYTHADSITERPFETQWTVRVRGAMEINVSSSRGVFLDPEGHVPAFDSRIVSIDVEIAVKVFSGWPLAGVSYVSSNTLASDVWNAIQDFLNWAWDGLGHVVGWILDIAKYIARQLSSLLEYLTSQASEALEIVYEAIAKVVDVARSAVRDAVSAVMKALGFIILHLPRFEFCFSGFGLTFLISVNGQGPEKLAIAVGISSFYLNLRFVHLTDGDFDIPTGSPEWDMQATWRASLGDFSTDGSFDPLMIVSGHFVEGTANWHDSWRLDFEMPRVEMYHSEDWSLSTPPIQTPIGCLEFEVGVKVRLFETPEEIDVSELIGEALRSAEEATNGAPLSWDSMVRFTAVFLHRLADAFLESLEPQIERVIDVTFYVSGEFKAADVAGAGLRLSIVVDRDGVMGLFDWLADNIRAVLDRLFNPSSPAQFADLPSDLPSHVRLSLDFLSTLGPPGFIADALGDIGALELKLVMSVQASVSFIGALIGLDWGPWTITFGVCLEDVPAIYIAGDFTDDRMADIWLMAGTLSLG